MSVDTEAMKAFHDEHKDEFQELYRNLWLVDEFRIIDGIRCNYKLHKFHTHKYPEKVSISAFENFVNERSVGKKAQASGNWMRYSLSLPQNFHVINGYSYMFREAMMTHVNPDHSKLDPYKGVKVVEHDSIFDFYKDIGYDYKKKKLNIP